MTLVSAMTEIPIEELRDLRRVNAELEAFVRSDRDISLAYCHWKLGQLRNVAESPSAGPSGPHLIQQIKELQELIPKPS